MIVYMVLSETVGSGRFNWYYKFSDAVNDIMREIPAVEDFKSESFSTMLRPVLIPEGLTSDEVTNWIDINIAGEINLTPEIER